MTVPIVLDLDAIEAAAKAATPQDFDSAEEKVENGHIECPQCGGQGEVELEAGYCNYDGAAIGVQFYGIGHEFGAAEAFYRAANPKAVIELIRRLRAAEALTASRIEQVPKQAKTVLVFAEITNEHKAEAEEFATAIQRRCISGNRTLVAFFPSGADVKTYDEEQLRQIGFMRLPSGRVPDVQLKSTLDDGRAPAVVARERGWGPGTRIVGDEGPGPEVIEITAVGEYELLAKTISRNGEPVSAEDFDEESWTLDCRDWQEVPS